MRVLLVLGAVSMLAVEAAPATPKSWRFKTSATPEVKVELISGSVKAQAAAGNEVAIDAVITGVGDSDKSAFTVDVRGEGDRVHARVCCGPCDKPTGRCDSEARVDFTVRLPATSRLDVRSVSADVSVAGVSGEQKLNVVSGKIDVRGANAPAQVRSVSGDVSVEGPSRLEANTVSGKVQWAGACRAGCQLQTRTVSGDVTLRFARESAFDVRYHSTSGELDDKLGAQLNRQDGPGRSSATGRYGAGGGTVECSSVSGDLQLAKR